MIRVLYVIWRLFFFRRQPLNTSLKLKRKAPYHGHSELALYTKYGYLAEIRIHELRAQARTRCESISVPHDISFGQAATN